MQIESRPFGTHEGKAATLHVVTDENTGFQVAVTDFGATLVQVRVPDNHGKVDDVNFGQDSPSEYIEHGGYLGAVTGRVANRISNACFSLDGAMYPLLANNNGVHALHGGKVGFNHRMWTLQGIDERDGEVRITYAYTSPDGEEGFPGTLHVETTYVISPGVVGWIYTATTDKPTIVNITNHAYWNLDGLDALIDDQVIRVDASSYMPADGNCLATGEVLNVRGTPADLHEPRPFADIFTTFGDLDNNFFLDNTWKKHHATDVVFAAELRSPSTGRVMKVLTSEPCIQLYSGNFMANIGTSFGKPCKKHGAICLETQRPPNAINNPVFARDVILRPGERYHHETRHEFSW